jgi:hypothetical protein
VPKVIQEFEVWVRELLSKFITGNTQLRVWASDDIDPNIRKHINSLRIPIVGGEPSLLLHNIGRSKHDKNLETRVNAIFQTDGVARYIHRPH